MKIYLIQKQYLDNECEKHYYNLDFAFKTEHKAKKYIDDVLKSDEYFVDEIELIGE